MVYYRRDVQAIREDYDAVLATLHAELDAYHANAYRLGKPVPDMIGQLLTEAALLDSELSVAIIAAEEEALGQGVLL